MSQDHLELFLGCVRDRGGFNNNPNSVQFKNTLRQLLFTKNITVESGNCSNLDSLEGDIIEFSSEKCSLIEPAYIVNKSELEMYLSQLDSINLRHYGNLDYIVGYIVRSILNKTICSECINLLVKNNFDYDYGHSNFTTSVSRGKLINISNAVSLIIQQLEKSFQVII